MSLPDRKIQPEFEEINYININQVSKHLLDNGIPVYFINSDNLDLVKIEFLFPAGLWYQNKHFVAYATNSLLREGTKKHSSLEISELIDYYGASLQTETTGDSASVALISLNKHLENLIPLVKEILTEAVFPEEELQTFKRNCKQLMIINNEKVDYIAKKKFNELLFGNQHPYGYNATIDDYDLLSREDLIAFYSKYYNLNKLYIIIAGKVNNIILDLLNNHFGKDQINNLETPLKAHTIHSSKIQKHFIKKGNVLQAAIRVGKILFNKKHKDYIGMQVLNTILGGYFGSRLMSNIREDKGFTYGINSMLISLKHEGYFVITTEAGVDVCTKTLNEIYFELKRLRTELIPEEELHLVKNYLLGAFLKSVATPFGQADRFKSIFEYGLGYEYYDMYFSTVKSITSEELKNLAEKYFQEESLYELIAGDK